MDKEKHLNNVRDYFETTLKKHGATPRGVDWNTEETREARFEQLMKIVKPGEIFSILDYGCGYGALIDYLKKKRISFSHFYGFDIAESMITAAKDLYRNAPEITFSTRLDDLPVADYATACGVFNMKQDANFDSWTDFVIQSLIEMDSHSKYGFSVNFLTKYSDLERMRSDLYYADPGFLFDYCKKNFSKNVALLHDYGLYDFTILIRKNI